ncbi:MAG: hypothetical protein ABR583_00860 [Gaiellaceae bacterium]
MGRGRLIAAVVPAVLAAIAVVEASAGAPEARFALSVRAVVSWTVTTPGFSSGGCTFGDTTHTTSVSFRSARPVKVAARAGRLVTRRVVVRGASDPGGPTYYHGSCANGTNVTWHGDPPPRTKWKSYVRIVSPGRARIALAPAAAMPLAYAGCQGARARLGELDLRTVEGRIAPAKLADARRRSLEVTGSLRRSAGTPGECRLVESVVWTATLRRLS